MSLQLRKHDITPLIIRLGHFIFYNNRPIFDEEGEENVKKLEKALGEIVDIDTIIDFLPNKEKIDSDTITFPPWHEVGRKFELYKFKYGGKTYYALVDCNWDSYSWVCNIDIYDNYNDVKRAIKSFYESIVEEIEDWKPNIEDEKQYEELEELEDYAKSQIKKLK